MKFIVDEQLPADLATWLMARGHEAVHVDDLRLTSTPDGRIWDHAVGTAAIVATKDKDYAYRRRQTRPGPSVLWIRVANAPTDALLAFVERAWTTAQPLLSEDCPVVEMARDGSVIAWRGWTPTIYLSAEGS